MCDLYIFIILFKLTGKSKGLKERLIEREREIGRERMNQPTDLQRKTVEFSLSPDSNDSDLI